MEPTAKFILIEGQKYLLWLVENILDTIGNPPPGQQMVSLGRPQTPLFESLISLGVLGIEPRMPEGYDAFVKGPNYGTWLAANTTLALTAGRDYLRKS